MKKERDYCAYVCITLIKLCQYFACRNTQRAGLVFGYGGLYHCSVRFFGDRKNILINLALGLPIALVFSVLLFLRMDVTRGLAGVAYALYLPFEWARDFFSKTADSETTGWIIIFAFIFAFPIFVWLEWSYIFSLISRFLQRTFYRQFPNDLRIHLPSLFISAALTIGMVWPFLLGGRTTQCLLNYMDYEPADCLIELIADDVTERETYREKLAYCFDFSHTLNVRIPADSSYYYLPNMTFRELCVTTVVALLDLREIIDDPLISDELLPGNTLGLHELYGDDLVQMRQEFFANYANSNLSTVEIENLYRAELALREETQDEIWSRYDAAVCSLYGTLSGSDYDKDRCLLFFIRDFQDNYGNYIHEEAGLQPFCDALTANAEYQCQDFSEPSSVEDELF